MTTTPRHEADPGSTERCLGPLHGTDDRHGGHGGHGALMMLMCAPMLLIAGFLIATGAGFGVLLPALLCVAMMAAMMLFIPGGHGHK